MTNNEDMKWTRKAVFDYHEYSTQTGNWKFCIDGSGSDWRLRGWFDGKCAAYMRGKTLAEMKIEASRHATA